MKIYFLRHGMTKWNKRMKLQGQVDVPLAPEGIEQAELAAKGMADIPFDIIFSSPLKRAYLTAQIMRGEREIPIIRDKRLTEMSFGIAEGRKFAKIKNNPAMPRYQRLFTDPEHFRPLKNGESFSDLLKRTEDFFKEQILPLEGKKENILVVSHGCAIQSFLANLNQWVIRDFWKTPVGKNCSATLFECVDGQVRMVFVNKLFY